jgi:hypothetical protein
MHHAHRSPPTFHDRHALPRDACQGNAIDQYRQPPVWPDAEPRRDGADDGAGPVHECHDRPGIIQPVEIDHGGTP